MPARKAAAKHSRNGEQKQAVQPAEQKQMFGESPAERLQFECRSVKLSFGEIGRQKQLSEEHKAEIAETLNAEERALSLSKRLFDSNEPAIKKVNGAKNAIKAYWVGLTLPFTEAGERLIRESDIVNFTVQIDKLIHEFHNAVSELDAALPHIVERERERLGRAFSASDYPSSIKNLFRAEYEFRNTSPPDYLAKLKPELYEREVARMRARFDEAVQLAEQALMVEFQNVLDQLVQSLQGVSAGTQKTFRGTTIDRLLDVFDQFNNKLKPFGIAVGSPMEKLIEQAKKIIKGVPSEMLAESLRKSDGYRNEVAEKMSQVRDALEKEIEVRPALRRRVIRQDAVA